jgi:hypothetical protein
MIDPKKIAEWRLAVARGKQAPSEAAPALLRERDDLIALLREVHEQMQTWFSSEYMEYPLTKRIAVFLANAEEKP